MFNMYIFVNHKTIKIFNYKDCNLMNKLCKNNKISK